MTWHMINPGVWWRPHTNGRDAWQALQGYDTWALILRPHGATGPPFLQHVDTETDTVALARLFRHCKMIARKREAQTGHA